MLQTTSYPCLPHRCAGFTLIEAIIVMLITGVIAGVVAIFIQKPVEGYFDTVRRAQLTDTADLALRRIAREVQTALPNTIRSTTSGSSEFLEFLPVRSGGRYRASADGVANALDMTNSADNDFEILGPALNVQSGDGIVIYNTGQTGANAYAGDNRRTFSGTAGAALTSISFSGSQFPRDSPSYTFQVVSKPITYACNATTGTLWRYDSYSIQTTQPSSFNGNQLVTGGGNVTGAIMATNVVCASSATDLGTGFLVRNADALLGLRIQLRDSGGEVRLFREVHVDNVP